MKYQKLFFAIACLMVIALFSAFWLQGSTTAKASAANLSQANNPNGVSACQQYSASDVPITIIDNSTITSTISVADNVVIEDVNVLSLNITHTFDSDLKTYLVSPSGTKVALFLNVGGTDDNFVDTNLDDSAPTNIQDGSAPFTGTYNPVESLSSFIGGASQGQWRLAIEDVNNGDNGALLGWQLELCSSGGFPTATPSPTVTPSPTASSTSTPTVTPVNTSTPIPTSPSTNTPTVTPTVTATSTAPTATPTTSTTPVVSSGEIYLPIIAR